MEEEYMSLYEAVDEVKSKVVSKDEYEKLSTTDRVQGDISLYQLPHSNNTSYVHHLSCSDNNIISSEVQSMKKALRHIKILCACGTLTTLMLAVIFLVTVAILSSRYSNPHKSQTKQLDYLNAAVNPINLSLIQQAGHLTKVDIAFENLTEQVNDLKDAITKLELPRNITIFERCFKETESCNFRSFDEGSWLSCETNNVHLNREVSTTHTSFFACIVSSSWDLNPGPFHF